MRRFLLLGMLACDACLDPVAYTCESDVQCARGAVMGTCEEEGYCSFPDDTCASNRRFAELAPAGIAGQCVVEGGSTGTVPPPTGTSVDPSTTTSVGTSTSTTSSMSTTDADGSSSTTLPITSGPEPTSSSTGEPELPDPIGWWAMDELEGGMVPDHGTGGTPGTLVDNATLVPGKRGSAVQLDGDGDGVEIGDHAVHDVEQFTFAAWIWIAAPSGLPRPNILGKGFSYRFRLEGTTTRPGVAFHDEGSASANSTGSIVCAGDPLETERWYHVAVTFGEDEDGSSRVRVYVDGDRQNQCVNESLDGSVDIDDDGVLRIGLGSADTEGNVPAFNGMIDEVLLYDQAIPEDRIPELMAL